MKIGMCVLNYNDSLKTIDLVKKTLNLNYFYKIVVVDNCSTESNREKLKELERLNCKVVYSSKNLGYARGSNIGLKYLVEEINCDYVFNVNSDIQFSLSLCEEFLKYITTIDDLAAISSSVEEFDGSEGTSYWKFPTFWRSFKWLFWLYRRNHSQCEKYDFSSMNDLAYVDVLRASFVCFDSKKLKKINYFDENTFLYFEENIICDKIMNNGFRCAVLLNNYYKHNHPHINGNINKFSFKCNFESAYYYFVTYKKINFFKRILFKVFTFFSMIEINCYLLLKRCS